MYKSDRYSLLNQRTLQLEALFEKMDPVDWSMYGSETDSRESQAAMFGRPMTRTDIESDFADLNPTDFGLLELYLWNASNRIDAAITEHIDSVNAQTGSNAPKYLMTRAKLAEQLQVSRLTFFTSNRLRRLPLSLPISVLQIVAYDIMHTSVADIFFSHPKKQHSNEIILDPILSSAALGCVNLPDNVKKGILRDFESKYPQVIAAAKDTTLKRRDVSRIFTSRLHDLVELNRVLVGDIMKPKPKSIPGQSLEAYYSGELPVENMTCERLAYYSIYLGASPDYLICDDYLRYADKVFMQGRNGLVELTDEDVLLCLRYICLASDDEIRHKMIYKMSITGYRRGYHI